MRAGRGVLWPPRFWARWLGSRGPSGLASRPDHLSKPPALPGTHCLGALTRLGPLPRSVICICRIETGKQYISVCANALPPPPPPVLFIWNVLHFTWNDRPSVAGKAPLRWAAVGGSPGIPPGPSDMQAPGGRAGSGQRKARSPDATLAARRPGPGAATRNEASRPWPRVRSPELCSVLWAAPLPPGRGPGRSQQLLLPLSATICTAWGKGPLTLSLKLPETTWPAWWWLLHEEGEPLGAFGVGSVAGGGKGRVPPGPRGGSCARRCGGAAGQCRDTEQHQSLRGERELRAIGFERGQRECGLCQAQGQGGAGLTWPGPAEPSASWVPLGPRLGGLASVACRPWSLLATTASHGVCRP